MKHQEKLGRPSIEDPEKGANIELGQPVAKEEFGKESVEATLEVIKEALNEFYRRRSSRDEQAAFIIQAMPYPLRPYSESAEEIKKENGNMTIPLAVLEAVLGEIQYEYDILSSLELDGENQDENDKIKTVRRNDFEKEMHYQEASDVLFSHADYETPTHDELIEFLNETKKYIKNLAKEEEKKYSNAEEGEDVNRIFRSRLLTDVPAIERYETGRHTTRDYDEIMEVIGSRLFSDRDRIGAVIIEYAQNPQEMILNELGRLLKEARNLELFLSQLEGERNERIVKEKPFHKKR